jgi:hypothetical protein
MKKFWIIFLQPLTKTSNLRATASINILMEAVVLGQPPRLIGINRGGHLIIPTQH